MFVISLLVTTKNLYLSLSTHKTKLSDLIPDYEVNPNFPSHVLTEDKKSLLYKGLLDHMKNVAEKHFLCSVPLSNRICI